jgi:membrane-associated phospholipid phosphatase
MRKLTKQLLVFGLALTSGVAAVQEPVPQEGPRATQAVAQPAETESPIGLKQFATDILHDQRPIFTFPWQVVHGKHWKPVLAVTLGTAALVVLDPYIEPVFHDRSRFDSYKTGPLRGRNTTLAVTMTPPIFFVTGLITHQTHERNTGLLAAEALMDTQIVSFVIKQSVGRLKPDDIPPNGDLRHTWFQYKGSLVNGGGFPSGHTASAFGVATVIAERYHQRRWVPFVAYGAATFLSLSRLPTRAHFPSDIFIGAAMGYSISHFIVLRRP